MAGEDAFSGMTCGDYRRSLESLRDLLASSLVGVEPKERAPLAKQLADVLTRLEGLPTVDKESRLDELARRRADRRGEPSDGAAAGDERRPGSGRASS